MCRHPLVAEYIYRVYIKSMAIEFDPDKDRHNTRKHGISLARAEDMEMEDALVFPDDRKNYGEPRFNAYGEIDGELYAMSFTPRGANSRVISLRRCRPEEVETWRNRSAS